jgi:peptide/nickel transport system substrate-binding protein
MGGRAKLAGVLVAAATAMSGGAHAEKATDTLRVVWRDAIPNVDPYYNTLRTGLIFQQHTMDGLVYRDPNTFQITHRSAIKATNGLYIGAWFGIMSHEARRAQL